MQRYLSTALAATAVTVSMVAGFGLPACSQPGRRRERRRVDGRRSASGGDR